MSDTTPERDPLRRQRGEPPSGINLFVAGQLQLAGMVSKRQGKRIGLREKNRELFIEKKMKKVYGKFAHIENVLYLWGR